MTPETTAMGHALILGAVLIFAGGAIVLIYRSAWADRRVKNQAAHLGLHEPDFILCAERRPSQSLPFPCTRHLGHEGDHAAGTAHGQVLATWTNVDEMPPLQTIPHQRGAVD